MSVPIIMSGYAPTLGATITSVATSLTLSADSGDNGHVWMLIDTEIMDGDKSGTTVSNLSRASEKYNGSAVAAGHTTGATVYFILGRGMGQAAFAYKYDEQTLAAGSQATFVIPASGSLPTTPRNLKIEWKAKTDQATAQPMFIRFNGDSGNNYDYQNTTITGTTVGGGLTSNTSAIRIGAAADSGANLFNYGYTEIQDFNVATRHGAQSYEYRNDAGLNGLELDAGVYKIAAALTSITVSISAGNFTTATFVTYILP